MRIQMADWIYKPFSLLIAAGVVAAAVAFLQSPPPARPPTFAAPAGIQKMQLLRDEHETMRVFLAQQDARTRVAAAIESEPAPDEASAYAKAELEPAIASIVQASKRPQGKPIRIVRASARPPLSILPAPAAAFAQMPPPPAAFAQLPPPRSAPPPRMAHGYGWVRDATRLPRRLWAAVGELMDEPGPPIPPRPIPPV